MTMTKRKLNIRDENNFDQTYADQLDRFRSDFWAKYQNEETDGLENLPYYGGKTLKDIIPDPRAERAFVEADKSLDSVKPPIDRLESLLNKAKNIFHMKNTI